jgi:hypothetical protein
MLCHGGQNHEIVGNEQDFTADNLSRPHCNQPRARPEMQPPNLKNKDVIVGRLVSTLKTSHGAVMDEYGAIAEW